jgi:hypothetical protein
MIEELGKNQSGLQTSQDSKQVTRQSTNADSEKWLANSRQLGEN